MSNLIGQSSNWKAKAYIIGTVGGAVFGLAAAFLYARAAEEEALQNDGKPPQIPTTALIGFVLSAMGLARQIAEAGRPKRK